MGNLAIGEDFDLLIVVVGVGLQVVSVAVEED
jgi:hypothetical protein